MLLALALLIGQASRPVQPIHKTIDLSHGEAQSVSLPGATPVTVRLVSTRVVRFEPSRTITAAFATVAIGQETVELPCANYSLPRRLKTVQADCEVTGQYRENSSLDHWSLTKDARIRIWPAKSPWIAPGTFGYPVRQTWFATETQLSNEPVFASGIGNSPKIYYHSGIDLGGADGLTEIVAATDAEVVSLGKEILPNLSTGHPVQIRYDVIYLRDPRGWYYRYSHLHSFHPALKLGAQIKRGTPLGLLGKEGASGGWTHLHFEIKALQPSGKYGTEDAYAFLWEAYQREHKPKLLAIARPHILASPGETVTLDATRSWTLSPPLKYRWTLTGGQTSASATPHIKYDQPGFYSESVLINDSKGRSATGHVSVYVMPAGDPYGLTVAPIHVSYHPTQNLKAGQPVTFLLRSFNKIDCAETLNFGDGTPPVSVKSDHNATALNKDGYARVTHAFPKPGVYTVEGSCAYPNRPTSHSRVTVDIR